MNPESCIWKEALLNILECFEANEGTWFQRDWKHFDISADMEAEIERAYAEKHQPTNQQWTLKK